MRRILGVLEMHFEVPLLPRSLCTTFPCLEFESRAIFFSILQNSFPQATSAIFYQPLHVGMNHPQLRIARVSDYFLAENPEQQPDLTMVAVAVLFDFA
jgi:hypothetical protein